MASRRDLKKNLKFITWELISECLVFQIVHPDASREKVMKTLEEITEKHNLLLALINVPENRSDKKVANSNYSAVHAGMGEMVKLVQELYKS